jgi:hypothetical protein
MNDEEMDLALREYGDRWRGAQPAPDVALGKPAGRRWPVVTAAAAAVVAIVGGAIAVAGVGGKAPTTATSPTAAVPAVTRVATATTSSTSRPTDRPTPVAEVPWKSAPAKGDPPPAGFETAPPCAATALDMTAYFAPAVGRRSPLAGVLEIRNTGEVICRVQAKFTFLPKGVRMPDAAGVTDELGPPAIMAPGDLAVSSLSWWGAECVGDGELATLRLIPHSNDGLAERDVPAAGLTRGACPRPFGDVGSGSWAATVTRRPDLEMLRLAAAIDAPTSVRRGGTLRFSVTLTNPSKQPVALDPAKCPVVAFGFDQLETHRLQCGKHHEFAPGQSVRFWFEAKAPSEPPPSPDPSIGKQPAQDPLLQWQFDALRVGGGTSVPVRLEP